MPNNQVYFAVASWKFGLNLTSLAFEKGFQVHV